MIPDSSASVAALGRCTRPGAALVWLGLLSAFSTAGSATHASNFRSILVDHRTDDWSGIEPVYTDASGDRGSAAVDLGRIFIANDDRFVYLRFEIGLLRNLQALSAPLHLHFDTDDNPDTGYPLAGIGSDLLVVCSPGGFGYTIYEQSATAFHASWLGTGPLESYSGPTIAATEFELRLLRTTLLPLAGRQTFSAPRFRMVFEALGGSGQVAERAPETLGGIPYDLATGVPEPRPDNDTRRRDPSHLRILTYNVEVNGMFGPEAPIFTRILRALNPDVIAFQELWDISDTEVASRLDQDLPLANGARWQAFKGSRGQVTASRYPIRWDSGAPFRELATLIDLPDGDFLTDLYVINSHLKCCGSLGSSEDQQRQESADAIVAWIRNLKIPGGAQLTPHTPIVHLGDFNLVGGPRPLETLLTGDIMNEAAHGADHPPDWDGTSLARSDPLHSDGLAAYTWRRDGSPFAPGKLDYILYTDSVIQPGNGFILNTLDMTDSKLATLGLLRNDTIEASDHLPVVQDFVMPRLAAAREQRAHPVLWLEARPNPMELATLLAFELRAAGRVSIEIYDGSGRRVRDLGTGWRGGTSQALLWDGQDDGGRQVRAGIYWVRLLHEGGPAGPSERAIRIAKLR